MRERGISALRHGDISAARRLLQAADGACDPEVARSLADTYDPLWLARHGMLNIVGLADADLAYFWYKRAAECGDVSAGNRYRETP